MHKRLTTILIVIICSLLLSCDNSDTSNNPDAILVLYAFSDEGKLLSELMEVDRIDTLLGREVYIGSLSGKRIVLAESGVGMNNASMTTQCMLDTYHPKSVLFSGIAGGIDSTVLIGDIVIPKIWIEHDYGYFGKDGFRQKALGVYNPVVDSIMKIDSFLTDIKLLSVATKVSLDSLEFEKIGDRQPKLIIDGVGVSGNAFIDNIDKRKQLQNDFNALVTDMESSAVAQVCFVNNIPFMIIRSASDLAGGSGSETAELQMSEFFKVAANNSALVLRDVLQRM